MRPTRWALVPVVVLVAAVAYIGRQRRIEVVIQRGSLGFPDTVFVLPTRPWEDSVVSECVREWKAQDSTVFRGPSVVNDGVLPAASLRRLVPVARALATDYAAVSPAGYAGPLRFPSGSSAVLMTRFSPAAAQVQVLFDENYSYRLGEHAQNGVAERTVAEPIRCQSTY